MSLQRSDVEHVARLARLALAEDELTAFTGQMAAILAYVEKLDQLETAGIVPTAHAVPMENAFRADAVRPSLGTEVALANAPELVGGYFKVPKVIE